MNSFNISTNDLLLMFAVFIIQHYNHVVELGGYILLAVISYIEIKKHEQKIHTTIQRIAI
jgi:Na+/H+-dicarboxylate symporter